MNGAQLHAGGDSDLMSLANLLFSNLMSNALISYAFEHAIDPKRRLWTIKVGI
jgi:hypothetical protein